MDMDISQNFLHFTFAIVSFSVQMLPVPQKRCIRSAQFQKRTGALISVIPLLIISTHFTFSEILTFISNTLKMEVSEPKSDLHVRKIRLVPCY